MKIELLEAGAEDCPLIRIYGSNPGICQRLREVFDQLANGSLEEVSLTDLPGIEPADGCRLIAQVVTKDRGILRQGEKLLSWRLAPASWANVAGLVEPFCTSGNEGYQWLYRVRTSDVAVLISTSGCW